MALAARAGRVSLPAEGLVRKQKKKNKTTQQSPNTIILRRLILALSRTVSRTR